MTRSPLRVALAEGSAVLGMGFGVWLIHSAFQPASNLPNVALVVLGALDILICFAILSYFLRMRLRERETLPRRWIAASVVLIAGFVGWLAALFLDSERLLVEEQHHRELGQQLAKLDDNLRHMGEAMAVAGVLDRSAWDANYDPYARLQDQLQATLRSRPGWDKDLTRIDEQVRLMKKAYTALPIENVPQQRVKLAGDFQLARDRAIQQSETLRTEVSQSEREVILHRRARWHGIGAGALAGIVAILGCVLMWLVFDRELARAWKLQARLGEEESRFRLLIENDEPLAVLDPSGAVVYANPAWQPALGRDAAELLGAAFLGLIHAEDRSRVLSVLEGGTSSRLSCRMSADYGIWHDVELRVSRYSSNNSTVVRVGEVRETAEFLQVKSIEPKRDPAFEQKLQDAEARVTELERRCESLRNSQQSIHGDLAHERWLSAQKDASGDGLLILSAQGKVLSWNSAFAQLWKLSAETMAGHTWPTIAGHMESLTAEGWTDFHTAASKHDTAQSDSCWEMTLEGGKRLEVYSQVLRDHPAIVLAVRFHFRDVTRNREMETQLRSHEEQSRQTQKKLKQLEKNLIERDRERKEMEATLLDHQDRLHKLHVTGENQETMRRLVIDVANEINNVLAIILGNTDVLRDALPPDHVAQKHLDDIHQAARKVIELSQRLHAIAATTVDIKELRASA